MRHNNEVSLMLIRRNVYRVGFLLLLSGLLSLAVVTHSTVKFAPAQALSGATFSPHIIAVPSTCGEALYIQADGIAQLGGTFFANVSVGPGHQKDAWTMTYSDTVDTLVATAYGFTPGVGVVSSMSITGTTGTQTFDTGDVEFNRAFVEALASEPQDLFSPDGKVQLTLLSNQTMPADTYVIIMSSHTPPAPPPLGHDFVSASYNVRAAGALPNSDKSMQLHLNFDSTPFCGSNPHTLAIFAWDAGAEAWNDLGGTLFYSQCYLSKSVTRFTEYALMATTTWRDDFWDYEGLSARSGVALRSTGGNLELVLSSDETSGWAISNPITPTTPFATWHSLVFTATVPSPTTTLTIDLLGLDNTPVLTNVSSGVDLSSLDAASYPALKLRASLSSTVAGETPALDVWRLTWQVEEHKVYLPVVLNW
jgi:hypothetical protein